MTRAELKAARESLGLTEETMAQLLGMRKQHYVRLEAGAEGRQPTKQQARAVENYLIIYEQTPWMIEYILSRVKN
jgi:DNA-binding XRE family transcriptional regulator